MKYSCKNCDCRILGVPFFDERKEFRRLNDDIVSKYPHLEECDKRVPGGRLVFRTDSRELKIEILLDRIYHDRGMSFYQANVGNIFFGHGPGKKAGGILSAEDCFNENSIYGSYKLNGELTEVTVFLPRNPQVVDIFITVDDDAQILPPEKFSVEKPFLFYGSSITENGHTSACNSYSAVVSRWFDADYYNFGFSGAAKGEPEIAEYMSGIDCSVFFYDYDHNAPDAVHLEKTHETFFKIFRKNHPFTPVIMTSRPANDCSDFYKRREIVKNTFLNALKCGDRNVYFIDGESFFDEIDREIATTDMTHPNDLGHYFMAKKYKQVLDTIL